jgi:hypothetical protein
MIWKILDTIFSKKLLYILVLVAIGILIFFSMRLSRERREIDRLSGNQIALMEENKYYRASDSSHVAEVKQLRLTKGEMKEAFKEELKAISDKLDIHTNKIDAISSFSTNTTNEFYVHVKDSIINDTQMVKVDFYQDEWLTYERIMPVNTNIAKIKYQSRDSITSIIHWHKEGKIPMRWFSPKLYELTINSMNPNSEITSAKYIKVVKKGKRIR